MAVPTSVARVLVVSLLAVLLVPRAHAEQTVRLDNPIAGFSMQAPRDWEMATGDLGNVFIGLDAPTGNGAPVGQPVLWFFYAKKSPQQMAQALVQCLQQLDGGTPQVRATGNGDEREITLTSSGTRGSLVQKWLCRSEHGVSYVVAALVRPKMAGAFAEEMSTALSSCRLIHRVAVRDYLEPNENAYRIALPSGWQWEGNVVRTAAVPGYFQWKAQNAEHTMGAFSAPPGVFNIATPYMNASQAAQAFVAPSLAKQIQGCRLDSIEELPRVGDYFQKLIRFIGLGSNPRMDKVRADFVGSVNGVAVRCRADVVTLMTDGSALLGGRGNWQMLVSGYWAPGDRWAQLGPVGRAVIASMRTDPQFKNNQFQAAGDAAAINGWWRQWRSFVFVVDYLKMGDTFNPPPLPPPDA